MVRLLLPLMNWWKKMTRSFNPTMVRLLLLGQGLRQPLTSQFQSHNGAIAAGTQKWQQGALRKFQSHNGAIAALISRCAAVHISLFQSHNGAIAARGSRDARQRQSHVSIPQWCDCCADWRKFWMKVKQSFNPTMVRLLLFSSRNVPSNEGRFQSHNGAIAACCGMHKAAALIHSFQSHNGAIAASAN